MLPGADPANRAERDRILRLAKKWKQENVSMNCACSRAGRLLVIGQGGSGGACGSSISVDVDYAHKCPECFATATSSATLRDDYDF